MQREEDHVEGRVQGNPRPARRPPLRLTIALVAALAASMAIGAVEVLPRVEDNIARYSKLSDVERCTRPATACIFGARRSLRFAPGCTCGAVRRGCPAGAAWTVHHAR